MNNIVTILPEGCTRFTHLVSKFCLPTKTPCDNTILEGLLTACGEQWNCLRLCSQDTKYFAPVPADGKIMFQVNYNRTDNSTGWGEEVGVDGWITIILTDETGAEVENALQYASRYLTGKSTKHAYQLIEMDISLIPEEQECFGFKITDGTTEVCTQIFKRQNSCDNLVEVEGLFAGFDCWNNYYGYPIGTYSGTKFAYSNKIYLKGVFKYYGGSSDLKEDLVKEFYRYYPDERIPPYMMKYLLKKVLAADYVIVDGETYYNEGSGTYNPASNGSSMFLPILEFVDKCGSSGSGACEY